MLEAFQRSAQADEARRVEAETSTGESASASAAGGPFAAGGDDAPPVRPADPPPRSRTESLPFGDDVLGTGPRRAPRMGLRLPLIVLAVVIAMAATFLIGRGFGGEDDVNAAGHEALLDELEADLGTGADAPGGSAPGDPPPAKLVDLTAADRAFLSRANNWTVIAISFANDARGGQLATQTYHYLTEQGLPAVAPITQGKFLLICVGAQPSSNAAIQAIRAQLQRLPGPPPAREEAPFASAYLANIEDLIDPRLRR